MPRSLQAFKADFFRALAHPIRIRILEVLGTGERSVQELQQVLNLEQSIVSQQLAILRGKNIVTPRKLGTTVRYALSDPLLGGTSIRLIGAGPYPLALGPYGFYWFLLGRRAVRPTPPYEVGARTPVSETQGT